MDVRRDLAFWLLLMLIVNGIAMNIAGMVAAGWARDAGVESEGTNGLAGTLVAAIGFAALVVYLGIKRELSRRHGGTDRPEEAT